jgi:Zn-dependent M16 (insulinase) family peptidase
LVLSLLEEILLGNAASPLRKALMDSGLGSALSDGTGFDPDNRDTLFSCGLKNVDREAAGKVEAVVMEVLERLSTDGIDPDLVAAAVHQIEFHRKEVSNTPYPYGLKLLLAFGGSWFHRGDPVRVLQFDEDMGRIREEIAKGPYLESKIKAYFLDNPHRILFELHPDQDMARKEEARVSGVLADIRNGLADPDLARIRSDAAALEERQAGKEDLTVLPTLTRGDIPPDIRTVAACRAETALDGKCYEAATAGIFYYSAAFGMGMVPERLVPLVPFFTYAMTKAGTARHDYMEMAKRIDTYTGGVGVAARVRTRADRDGRSMSYLQMESKCLERNQEKMFDIIAELAGELDFSNHRRLRQLLLEYRAGLETMVVQNGHRLAMSLAARRFLPQAAINETWYGVSQLQYIKALTDALGDEELSSLAGDLSEVGGHLFVKGNLKAAYIGAPLALKACSAFDAAIDGVMAAPGDGFDVPAAFGIPETPAPEKELPREGWYTSSSVSFVAQCFQAVRRDHPDAPVLALISKMLRSLYLHREIREKGGAYGGFSAYNLEDGIFSFASYRDPQIANTLQAFSGASDFILSGDYTESDLNEAMLQVCSEIDRPDPPGPAARKAFGRSLVSLTDDMRRRFKEALLATTRENVTQTARRYFSPDLHGQAVAVISGKDQLEAANRELGKEALDLRAI